MFRRTLLYIAVISSLASCQIAYSGVITRTDFGTSARVVDFNGLPLRFFQNGPLVIDGDQYTSDDGVFRYTDSFGRFLSTTGEGLGNNTDLGFIDIRLSQKVHRAGLVVGRGLTDVQFFDESDNLLGVVSVSDPNRGVFAAWESVAGNIARLRAIDRSAREVLLIDDLITERIAAVPEPSAFATVAALFTCACGWRRRAI